MTAQTMKAVVIREPGAPEVLIVEERPVPQAKADWVLIRVKAFDLNRSELFTRRALRRGSTGRPSARCLR